MSVLQRGRVSVTAIPNLQAGVSFCFAIEDSWATMAVAELSACGVQTGAAGVAGRLAACSGPFFAPLREYVGLSADARVFAVATESPSASEQA